MTSIDAIWFIATCFLISALFCTTRRWTVQKRWYLPYWIGLYAVVLILFVVLFIVR